MFNKLATAWFRKLGGPPCFRVHGKGRGEKEYCIIEVHATHRRDEDSPWPRFLFRGTCITWTASVVVVGWDFAAEVLAEQAAEPASREHPVEVAAGRLRDPLRRAAAGREPFPSASEVLAHECGHTWQARRLGWLYWPVGAAFTLFREGPHFWNRFENEASEKGQFGGIVNGSVCPELMARLKRGPGRLPPSEMDRP
jgi:hypothetical protein